MKLLASDPSQWFPGLEDLRTASEDCQETIAMLATIMVVVAGIMISFAVLGLGGLLHLLFSSFKKADKSSGGRATVTNIPKGEAFRIWRDSTDNFSVNAKFAGIHGTTVRLLREDGVLLKIPVAKLSQADVAYLATKQVAPPNKLSQADNASLATRQVAPPFRTLTGHEGPVHSIAFSPDGKTIAIAGNDKTIKLWDVSALTTS